VPPSLLRDAGFRRFWTAGVVSQLGSGVGGVALPLTAVTLGASAMDMGILGAAAQVPVLFLALHAGVWVDRLPRRPIMVVTNLGRGALLLAVPLAAWFDVLSIGVLWAVALAVGVLAVVFDLASTSYPPTLVARDRLADANAVLTAGGSGAQVVGRGAAGWIVEAVGASTAIAVDAVSFVAAALLVRGLDAPEPAERPERRAVRSEIAEGFATVWRDPVLRAMVACTTIASFGGAIGSTVFVLFAVREVGLSAPALGAVLSCGTAAGLAAALLAGRVSRWLTPGGAMIAAQAVSLVGAFLLAAAPAGSRGGLVLGAAQVVTAASLSVFSVTQISLRQAVTPPLLLGRVNATRRVTVFGVIPVGALLGGAVGDAFGLRTALVAAALVQLVSLLSMALSPLRTAREPEPEPA
jgi:predicted MFS family arabinose efflux permease